ncbi:phosphatase PAP2 family protein [Arthrobacter sp. H14-L1]|uniref:phosphatase PAP2 family protein n=1 Tax=Arthrobacter sp. H14-L1 TaxID=2996697 RepID=UPI002271A9EC|nr:phosphatase PAP2 family protein [Arthrobacter sp. H14-L1]MCY0903694.1 phosphatase PAP2 family protein [Arthrobacter sp. H14-L1]
MTEPRRAEAPEPLERRGNGRIQRPVGPGAARLSMLPLGSWFLVPIGLVLFALTLTIGLVAKSYGPFSPDLALDVQLSQGRSPFLTAIALGINYGLGPVGALLIFILICSWLWWGSRAPMRALAFGSITAVGWLSADIGKYTVARLRPPSSATHALVMETGHNSFPSGHTAFAASLAWAAILVLARPGVQRRLAIVAGALFAAVVAFSRIYLGVHYPTDVVGGVLISAAGIFIWLALWSNLIEPRLRAVKALNPVPHSATASQTSV